MAPLQATEVFEMNDIISNFHNHNVVELILMKSETKEAGERNHSNEPIAGLDEEKINKITELHGEIVSLSRLLVLFGGYRWPEAEVLAVARKMFCKQVEVRREGLKVQNEDKNQPGMHLIDRIPLEALTDPDYVHRNTKYLSRTAPKDFLAKLEAELNTFTVQRITAMINILSILQAAKQLSAFAALFDRMEVFFAEIGQTSCQFMGQSLAKIGLFSMDDSGKKTYILEINTPAETM